MDVSQNMPTTRSKLHGMTVYARILCGEVAGMVSMVPYACKSWWLYNRDAPRRVRVMKNCRYGTRERNVVDVYMPRLEDGDGENVVLFVHGGVWATGSKWHYAPLATRLAEEGIVTCVMEYSLYPSCRTDTMVGEVSQALDWVLDRHGKKNVFLVGHSAGAHLCAMSLLERSCDHTKMPDCFIGMAGVYDIVEHFEYEKSRKVHALSTMKRAIGGEDMFPVHSPTVVLKKYAKQQQKNPPRPIKQDVSGRRLLHGQRIPARVGLLHSDGKSVGGSSHSEVLELSPENIQRLPKTYLMASCTDVTVPWTESSEFHAMLVACGVHQSTLLLYHRIGHGDFVVDWEPQQHQIQEYTKELPEFAQDLLHIVKNGP